MNLNHSYYLLLLCNLDFSILELTLSTFLGFGSALLVEAIITYYNNKKYKKQTHVACWLSCYYHIGGQPSSMVVHATQ